MEIRTRDWKFSNFEQQQMIEPRNHGGQHTIGITPIRKEKPKLTTKQSKNMPGEDPQGGRARPYLCTVLIVSCLLFSDVPEHLGLVFLLLPVSETTGSCACVFVSMIFDVPWRPR